MPASSSPSGTRMSTPPRTSAWDGGSTAGCGARSTARGAVLLGAHPDRTLIVRNEDLKARTVETLAGIQAFLELSEADLTGSAGANSSFREGEERVLSATDVFWMNLVAGRAILREPDQL